MTRKGSEFAGLSVAIVTPFRDGKVDVEALRAHVDEVRELFAKLECAQCHKPPTYTSTAVYDVGLRDSAGNDQFNPPANTDAGASSARENYLAVTAGIGYAL